MSESTTSMLPSAEPSSLAERCMSHLRTSPASAAFRSSPIRKWRRLRWSKGGNPARRSPRNWARRGAWAGMSCLPPTGRRRSHSTASYSAGKKPTAISARWARIRGSPPEGRRSAACSPSLRHCRFPSGFTISTSTTSRRRRSAWKLAGAKSYMARPQCQAALGSSIAPTLRAPYSRCLIGAFAKLSYISSAPHRATRRCDEVRSVGSFRFRAATDRKLTDGSLDVEFDSRHLCEQIDIRDPDRASAEPHVGRHQVERLRQYTNVLQNERIGDRAILP